MRLVRGASDLKVETLINLITQLNQEPTLVFCNHREAVQRISLLLTKKNFKHGVFHGGLEQIDREKSLIKFRSGAHNVLIATDLAARGLDIPLIKHVIHFQYPVNKRDFLHRNGRTARMHAEGTAYLILSNEESLPDYLDEDIGKKIEEHALKPELKSYPEPLYESLYISAGKKDKIRKSDILGFLTQSVGAAGADIGLIVVLDKSSYVAVNRNKLEMILANLKDSKIKKMKVKIEVAS